MNILLGPTVGFPLDISAHNFAEVVAYSYALYGQGTYELTDKLSATFVNAGKSPPGIFELRSYLEKYLPHYTVPSSYVLLKEIPLTAHGKVDQKALPLPGTQHTGTTYIAPRNETEENLAKIWAGVLSVKRVGVDDDFFILGGHVNDGDSEIL